MERSARRAAESQLEVLQAQLAKTRGERLSGVSLTDLEHLLEQISEQSHQATARINAQIDQHRHRRRCAICMDRSKNTALVPCGHLGCAECVAQLSKCHICRSDIIQRLRTYDD